MSLVNNKEKLVSIIMPCFNASATLSKSIDSVLDQSYSNWELLIVNDCSTDNSKELLQSYVEKDSRIFFFNLDENSGVAAARNFAINNARGEFIAFLDSDDMWFPEKLKRQITFMEENGYEFSYTSYRKIDNFDNFSSGQIDVSTNGVNYKKLLFHNEIGCLTVILSRSIVGDKRMVKVGHEDFVFWLSILKDGVVAFGLNEVLGKYRVGNESISSNKLKAARFTWNIYRNVEKLSFLQSSYYFSSYAIQSLTKYFK